MDIEVLRLAHACADAAIIAGDGHPVGFCVIASNELCRRLGRDGHGANFVLGRFLTANDTLAPHAWVEMNGCIIDVTARQFGLDDVWIGSPRDHRYMALMKGVSAIAHAQRWFAIGQRPIGSGQRVFQKAMFSIGYGEPEEIFTAPSPRPTLPRLVVSTPLEIDVSHRAT